MLRKLADSRALLLVVCILLACLSISENQASAHNCVPTWELCASICDDPPQTCDPGCCNQFDCSCCDYVNCYCP